MLIRLTNTASITVDVPIDHVTWNASALHEHGDALIVLPRTSPAWNSAYISNLGGFLVEIAHGSSGWWRGIADRPQFSQGAARIPIMSETKWLEIRLLTRDRTFYGFTAGAIARIAVQDALAGLGVTALQGGAFVEAAPIIPKFQFTGQSLLDCLTALMAATGQEWAIDGGLISWIPAQGGYREFHLVDDGFWISSYTDGSLQDMAAETIEIQPDGTTFVVRAEDAPIFWPRQIVTRPSG